MQFYSIFSEFPIIFWEVNAIVNVLVTRLENAIGSKEDASEAVEALCQQPQRLLAQRAAI